MRLLAGMYIWLFRGTPVLVQLVIWYTLLANSGEFTIAWIALGLNEGAYMAEIVRAGLQAVDKGQTEAAQSLRHAISANNDAALYCRRQCAW